jgi:DNA uptake protein ComE-like DNA-binding protein
MTSSVFNLLAIDPLAGLDPVTRELANTRLFAERGLFLARHMPTLIRWESELLVIQTAEMPQMEKLLANTTQLSESADRFSQTVERLPGLISAERQQIVQALDEQQPGLTSLAAQTEKALEAGKLMSNASTATLTSFQDVLRQLQASPSSPNAEPFRINDYTAAAVQINATAQDLVKLLQAFDQTLTPGKFDILSTRLDALTRQTQASGKELVDYTFRQILFLGLILIGSACAMMLASAVAFWRLKKKFA